MVRDIAIVNYNTPELTTMAIRSVRKHTPGCRFTVFDNSDKYPFEGMDGVRVIDNTKGQVIDFDALLAKYPNKRDTANNHGSAKHIASVDYLFDVLPDGFLLMDSDVLVRWDISPLFDEHVAWCGKIEHTPPYPFMYKRIFPYLLWINVPMLRSNGIRFWHEGMVYKLSYTGNRYYDTAGSLLKDCTDARLPFKEVNIFDYIVHYGGASCRKLDPRDVRDWMFRHATLWDTKKYLVVIPYLPSAAQGRELEYAIAGWRKHFKEDYIIVVVGENLPAIDAEDVVCLESKRVGATPGQWRQHVDYVKCFRAVRDAFPEYEGFIFVADDCYAVNDFDIADVKFLKMLAPEMDFNPESTNGWRRDKAKTKAALIAAGLPTRNFTTHLPYWFDWDKIETLWDRYDMDHQSYVIEDLYYNTYCADRKPFQLNADTDNLKCGVYDKSNETLERLRQAPSQKIWITNSPDGWCADLEVLLQIHYKH